MKPFVLLVLSISLVFAAGCAQRRNSASSGGVAAQTNLTGIKAEAVDRLNDSGVILHELVKAPDDAIPEYVLRDAKCVAIVPSMVKGGFVFGARHGRGVATCRTNAGWSAPAFFTLTGGSWGAQIGLESVDVVMMIMNHQGVQDLLSSKFKLGAGGSIAAGPVGRQATAQTDYKLQAQVLTYSRARGIYAGLNLNGAVIQPDEETTVAFYRKHVPFRLALSGELNPPHLSSAFLSSVRESFHEARAAYR